MQWTAPAGLHAYHSQMVCVIVQDRSCVSKDGTGHVSTQTRSADPTARPCACMHQLCAYMPPVAGQAQHSHADMQNLPIQHCPDWATADRLNQSSDDAKARAEVCTHRWGLLRPAQPACVGPMEKKQVSGATRDVSMCAASCPGYAGILDPRRLFCCLVVQPTIDPATSRG